MRIIPAILATNVTELLEKCARVDQLVDRIQIDIVGRAFSAEVSVGVEALEQISSALSLDVQLMVGEPIAYLNRCDLAGASRVFGHVEHMRDPRAFIEYGFSLGMEVGLAVDLPTPIVAIERSIADLDSVLLMSVPAGRSGQLFDERVFGKIAEVKALRPDLPICVDGGITPSVVKQLVSEGATEFAVGNFLWESKDIGKAIANLSKAVQ